MPKRVGGRDRRRTNRKIGREKLHARFVVWFVRHFFGPILKHYFHLESKRAWLLLETQRPFVILANHTSDFDPFFINYYIPETIHYIVSDSQFRKSIVNLGLTLVNAIPKRKAAADMNAVRMIMDAKRARGVIGIFPEGQSSWHGSTLPIYYSTAKLVKSLRLPVISCRITGSFLSAPRWGRLRRRGRVLVDFERIFEGPELRRTPVEDVYTRIHAALDHNEFEVQRRSPVPFVGRRPAEYLERALFACPSCSAIETLESDDDRLRCTSCGYTVRLNAYGFFRREGGQPVFKTMRAWDEWQRPLLDSWIDDRLRTDPTAAIVGPEAVRLRIGYGSSPLRPGGDYDAALVAEGIRLTSPPDVDNDPETRLFTYPEIWGLNVQAGERMEFYWRSRLYQLRFTRKRLSVYLWYRTIQHLSGGAADAEGTGKDIS